MSITRRTFLSTSSAAAALMVTGVGDAREGGAGGGEGLTQGGVEGVGHGGGV